MNPSPLTLMVALLAPSVLAAPIAGPHGTVELVAAGSVAPGGTVDAALHFTMEPGWHIYWKNAGDSGTPPELAWRLPAGWSAGPLEWPYPKLIRVGPLANYGYEGEVFLPMRLKAGEDARPGTTARLTARAEWLICRKECLPGQADLALLVPVSKATAAEGSRWAAKIANARLDLPAALPDWTLSAAPRGKTLELSIQAVPRKPGQNASYWFFPEDGLLLGSAGAQPARIGQGGSTDLSLPLSDQASGPPARLRGVLVSSTGFDPRGARHALAVDIPVAAAGGFFWALLLAFAGGVLLNVMPCVFPVLAVKVLSLVEQAGAKPSELRRHSAVYTLGVFCALWTLAAALLVLRSAGERLGWGFQLQSPAFVAVLASLLLLLALSLLGVFEIGTQLVSAGGLLRSAKGLAGSFLGGALAVVIATPCTAPFMGAALGLALTLPAGQAFGIFTALAAGLAAPMAALCAQPSWLRRLPRPGPWLESFRQAMAFPLLGTVAWLSWVFALQTSPEASARLWFGFLFIGFAAWVHGRWGQKPAGSAGRGAARVLAAASGAAGVALALAGAGVWRTSSRLDWRPWSAQAVEQSRQEGRPVFVDFTAAWCITCQVNERLVLNRDDVGRRFSQLKFAALKADWTSRDPQITEALSELGRSGVPVYAVYGRDSAAPVSVLPTVLTPSLVLDALDKGAR